MSRRTIAVAVLAGLVLAAGLVAALGSAGSGTSGSQTASTPTITTGLPPGAQTQTQPVVTLRPPISRTAQTDLPGHGRPFIWLGDMNTDEQFVIGAMYKIALQQAGFQVGISRNIGITRTTLAAIKEGSLDLFPEYLNVWDRAVVGVTRRFPSARAAYATATSYAKRHGFVLLPAAPGGRTVGFAVTTQFARENHLHSLGGLGRLPELTFGIPLDFGALWKAERAYSFRVGNRQDILTGSQYTELTSGAVQVAWAYTTDPQLGLSNYTLLKDPKHVYGFGNIVPVTTAAVISAEGPTFVRIINRIDSLLTTRALRGLNAEVELYGRDPNTVAYEFLEGNRLMPHSRYIVSPGSG